MRRNAPGAGGIPRPLPLAVFTAGLLFIISGLLDAFRALAQLFPLDLVLRDLDLLELFFTATRFGRLTLAKLMLTPVYVGAVWWTIRWHSGAGAAVVVSRAGRAVTVLLGLALVYTVSAASHAAGKPGVFPVVSDMVHLLASSAWGGGLFYLASCAFGRPDAAGDWAGRRYRELHAMIDRFSNTALVAVAAVVATGAFATYLHVYDLTALAATRYGRSLALKLALFVAVVGVAGYNLMVLSPALREKLERQDVDGLRRIAARLRTAVGAEAAIVIGIIAAVGLITTLPPADTPGTVIAGVYEATAPGVRARVDLQPLDEPGRVAIMIEAVTEDGSPLLAGTRAVIDLDMPSHRMGMGSIEARETAPGRFEADAVLLMAGTWEMILRLTPPGGPTVETAIQFEAATGTLLSGRVRRLDLSVAMLTPVRQFTFGLGLLLIVLGGYGVIGGRRGRLVPAIIPLSLAMLAVGGYQVMSVTLTDALPTTFVRNPVPYTLEAVNRGAELYARHCAHCHGVEGRGDGILADSLRPRPANLTEEHVDEASDGDIFWWITHGIEQTAMPAFENVLSEEERWTVIHFVRSLRHFTPALEREDQAEDDTTSRRGEVSL